MSSAPRDGFVANEATEAPTSNPTVAANATEAANGTEAPAPSTDAAAEEAAHAAAEKKWQRKCSSRRLRPGLNDRAPFSASRCGGRRKISTPPPIIMTEAERARGVDDLADAFETHRAYLASSGGLVRKVIRRRERVFQDLLRERAAAQVLASAPEGGAPVLTALINGEIDPSEAVDRIFAGEKYFKR